MVDKTERSVKQFFLAFAICFAFIFAGCSLIDTIAGGLAQPKKQPTHGMTIDEYADWYNSHAKDNPGLTVPSPADEKAAIDARPTDPSPLVTSSDFEATKLAKGAEAAAAAAPIPYLREGVAGAVYLATLWSAYRDNRKKTKMVTALVKSIDKDGTKKLEETIEKTAIRLGVEQPLHKIVKKFKKAKAIVKEIVSE